tara:strand:- start:1295 stop:1579 length:285 start_codon:yes stop_codon:yes gene_type:complete
VSQSIISAQTVASTPTIKRAQTPLCMDSMSGAWKALTPVIWMVSRLATVSIMKLICNGELGSASAACLPGWFNPGIEVALGYSIHIHRLKDDIN